MSDDRNHTIAAVTVTSEEAPYGVRIDTRSHELRGGEPADRGGAGTGPAPFDRLITLHGVDEDRRAKLAEVTEKTPVARAVRARTEIRTITRRPDRWRRTRRSAPGGGVY